MLDLRKSSINILKKAEWKSSSANFEAWVEHIAKYAYIVGYYDRALEAEDLKLKSFTEDELFNEFLENVRHFANEDTVKLEKDLMDKAIAEFTETLEQGDGK